MRKYSWLEIAKNPAYKKKTSSAMIKDIFASHFWKVSEISVVLNSYLMACFEY